jgi:hypothetical protein
MTDLDTALKCSESFVSLFPTGYSIDPTDVNKAEFELPDVTVSACVAVRSPIWVLWKGRIKPNVCAAFLAVR